MRNTLFALALVAPLAAQTLEPGYAVRRTITLPNGASNVLVLGGGADVVWFTGTDLVLRSQGAQRALLSFPAPVFGSFTIEVGRGRLLFGESSNGDIWLVPLAPATPPRIVARVPLNYDAVAIGPDQVVVSAKTGGFAAPDNDLVHVDLASGATQVVARAPGASGPVAWTLDGLFYATASASFPPPPGASHVLLWPRMRVLGAIGSTPLGQNDAIEIARGIDSASDLAIDGDLDVLVTDWLNGRVFEVSLGLSGGTNRELRRSTLIGYPATAPQPTALQHVPARGPSPQFEPFQPDDAAVLYVHESTYGGASQVRVVTPARPVTTAPAPIAPGPFDLVTVGGPGNGVGIVAVGPNPLIREFYYPVNGFDQLVMWDQSMLFAWDTIPVAFDAHGVATLRLVNPGLGGAPFPIGAQCAFVDANRAVVGSAAPIALHLR